MKPQKKILMTTMQSFPGSEIPRHTYTHTHRDTFLHTSENAAISDDTKPRLRTSHIDLIYIFTIFHSE